MLKAKTVSLREKNSRGDIDIKINIEISIAVLQSVFVISHATMSHRCKLQEFFLSEYLFNIGLEKLLIKLCLSNTHLNVPALTLFLV